MRADPYSVTILIVWNSQYLNYYEYASSDAMTMMAILKQGYLKWVRKNSADDDSFDIMLSILS